MEQCFADADTGWYGNGEQDVIKRGVRYAFVVELYDASFVWRSRGDHVHVEWDDGNEPCSGYCRDVPEEWRSSSADMAENRSVIIG
jgi:hypothetical protein